MSLRVERSETFAERLVGVVTERSRSDYANGNAKGERNDNCLTGRDIKINKILA